jgi:molybdopterin/thiamine biosynthesis adenylyltransferase
MQRGERTKEQEPVLLTLSNAVDQTQKIKVEVPPNTTIKQASIDAGVAPNGAFDVFTAGGKAVTLSKADHHRGEVLYVGPQKVAGGSDRSSSGKGDDEFGSEGWLQDHRWHRQSGLLDQEMVASLDIGLEGHDESMLGLLLELDLLGACRSGCGEVSIDRGPEEEVSIRMLRGLVDFTTSSWGEVQRLFSESGMSLSLRELDEADIWIGTADCPRPEDHRGAWLIHGAGSALVGSGSFPPVRHACVRETMIDAATLVCGVSALLHRYLRERSAFWQMEVVDRWLTLTARVDDVDPELALKGLRSKFGRGTATRTSDGRGSLIRYRFPLKWTPPELLSLLSPALRMTTPAEDGFGPVDVGPFPSKTSEGGYCFDSMTLPEKLSDVNALVLGVGGLGSWATPLLLSGCDLRTSTIGMLDGDQEVEVHNLNRQVLYGSKDLGCAKATAAASRLRDRFGMTEGSVLGIPAPLGAQHVMVCSEESEGDISLQEVVGCSEHDEVISSSLDSMQIALSCLDNQNARTLLNTACLDRGVSMVNGGGEGTRGVVEHFGQDLCMVCRYGPEEAYETERVSCQEEGSRPVSSIVTTTAYVGALQAAMALCLLAEQRGHGNEVPEARDWWNGMVSRRECGRLPWVKGGCGRHG